MKTSKVLWEALRTIVVLGFLAWFIWQSGRDGAAEVGWFISFFCATKDCR